MVKDLFITCFLRARCILSLSRSCGVILAAEFFSLCDLVSGVTNIEVFDFFKDFLGDELHLIVTLNLKYSVLL